MCSCENTPSPGGSLAMWASQVRKAMAAKQTTVSSLWLTATLIDKYKLVHDLSKGEKKKQEQNSLRLSNLHRRGCITMSDIYDSDLQWNAAFSDKGQCR